MAYNDRELTQSGDACGDTAHACMKLGREQVPDLKLKVLWDKTVPTAQNKFQKTFCAAE